MDLLAVLPSLISLVVGAALTYTVTALTNRAAHKREDDRERRQEATKKAEVGRAHAEAALRIIRRAQHESRTRPALHVYDEIDLGGLDLETAATEIELIPDPVLRPRLASVLDLVRYPGTLTSSSLIEGPPADTQRMGLYLLRESLAAYVRDEPTPVEADDLANLAKANQDAHDEREELYARDARNRSTKQLGR
ncbi:MAG: hypothetical protein VB093_03195 [Propionicimonas sp.]|nr:hypothetical protein [Propionicimonas sp.]